jgi:hypothetical protein
MKSTCDHSVDDENGGGSTAVWTDWGSIVEQWARGLGKGNGAGPNGFGSFHLCPISHFHPSEVGGTSASKSGRYEKPGPLRPGPPSAASRAQPEHALRQVGDGADEVGDRLITGANLDDRGGPLPAVSIERHADVDDDKDRCVSCFRLRRDQARFNR